MYEFVMGTDGKGVCMNLLRAHYSPVHLLVVLRSLEEGALKLQCPHNATAPALDRVLGVLVPFVQPLEGVVPPQPMADMVLFGVLGFCGGE